MDSHRYDAAMSRWLAIIVTAGVLITFPVWLPVVFLLDARDCRLKQGVAEKTQCSRCGATLGLTSLGRANAAWAQHVAALQRRLPQRIFRLGPRRVWAVCVACGAEYGFDDTRRAFISVSRDP